MKAVIALVSVLLPFLAAADFRIDRVAWNSDGQLAVAYSQPEGKQTTLVVDLIEDKEISRNAGYDAELFSRPNWKEEKKATFSSESDFYVDGRRTVIFLSVQTDPQRSDLVLGYSIKLWNMINQEKLVCERTYSKSDGVQKIELLGTLKSPLEPRLAFLVLETKNGERKLVVYGSHTGIGFR